MSKSRYVKTTRWKLPRHRRSVRLPGAEEDRGRYLKCWNCGFIVDTKLGLASPGSRGLFYTDSPNPTVATSMPGYQRNLIAHWKSPFFIGLLPRNGPDGTPSTFLPDVLDATQITGEAVVGACPLCGTTNLP